MTQISNTIGHTILAHILASFFRTLLFLIILSSKIVAKLQTFSVPQNKALVLNVFNCPTWHGAQKKMSKQSRARNVESLYSNREPLGHSFGCTDRYNIRCMFFLNLKSHSTQYNHHCVYFEWSSDEVTFSIIAICCWRQIKVKILCYRTMLIMRKNQTNTTQQTEWCTVANDEMWLVKLSVCIPTTFYVIVYR